MQKSLKSRYQTLLLIFFIIVIMKAAMLLLVLHGQQNLMQLKDSIRSVIILFMLVQFIYFIIMYYYVPYKYDRALQELYQLIQEISEGKYQIDLEAKTHNQSKEISGLMVAMQKMMNIIIRFDSLKADKIYEHHQRIQSLINMIPEGCLIISIIGEIVYINDFVKAKFPALSENLNILESLLPEYIEDDFKPLLVESIKSGTNLHDKKLLIKTTGESIAINSSIVRNRKGQAIGAIFILDKA